MSKNPHEALYQQLSLDVIEYTSAIQAAVAAHGLQPGAFGMLAIAAHPKENEGINNDYRNDSIILYGGKDTTDNNEFEYGHSQITVHPEQVGFIEPTHVHFRPSGAKGGMFTMTSPLWEEMPDRELIFTRNMLHSTQYQEVTLYEPASNKVLVKAGSMARYLHQNESVLRPASDFVPEVITPRMERLSRILSVANTMIRQAAESDGQNVHWHIIR